MSPRVRQCGNPQCAICRFNEDGLPPDSGHPVNEDLAELALGAAMIIGLFLLLFVVWPVLS